MRGDIDVRKGAIPGFEKKMALKEQPGKLTNQDEQLIIKIFTPTNQNFEYLQMELDQV